ncbi:GDSL esterase/lipase 1, partial [Cucurbita argyrosperma subsp. sororia]
MNKNYVHGVNFASAGAGALAETHQGLVIDLKTQLSYFNKVTKVLVGMGHPEEAKALLSKAVYFISIGSNDYIAPFTTNSTLFQSHSPQEYVELGIHTNGGRKFAFLGVGDIGCVPLVKAVLLQGKDECSENITQLVTLHNKHLYKALQHLEKELEGFVYSYADLYTSANQISNNPSKYGFKEGKAACCGSGPFRGFFSCGGRDGEEYELCSNPNEYLFYDSAHLTQKASQLVAEWVWNGSSDSIKPYNLKALFNV